MPTVDDRLQQMPLIDPSFLASGWQLSTAEPGIEGGESSHRMRAKRLETGIRPDLWHFIDEYEIAIHRQRGVLLQYTPIVEGRQAANIVVTSLQFDVPIPDSVFTFAPPKGAQVVVVGGSPQPRRK